LAVISDPRTFPLSSRPVNAVSASWHALVEQGHSAQTGQERSAAEVRLHADLVAALVARDVPALLDALETAPSPVCHRQLLRGIDAAWVDPQVDAGASLVAHGFALPVVLVAASDAPATHPLVLGDPGQVIALMQEHGALAGNASVALANVLAGPAAVGVGALAEWLAWREAGTAATAPREIPPVPLRITGNQEGAHLRFLVGSALAAPGARLFGVPGAATWATPLARHLSAALAAPGLQLLALPRHPEPPVAALRSGQLAQREIALGLFASHAIRTLRANFGEPSAVVSAHGTVDGGELRVSLSSVFGERDAEGFRCPLFPYDRFEDVVAAILDLLRECRINDIRQVSGIQPDRDPATGGPLFFRADANAAGEAAPLH
jgi:hypothetical protein